MNVRIHYCAYDIANGRLVRLRRMCHRQFGWTDVSMGIHPDRVAFSYHFDCFWGVCRRQQPIVSTVCLRSLHYVDYLP